MSFETFLEQEKYKKRKSYEIENIDNPCVLTLAVNPKEYLELFEDKNIDKKHKGIKKSSSGLGFENFAQRIGSLVNFGTFEKPPRDTEKVSKLNVNKLSQSVMAGEVIRSTYIKNKFSQINDKIFYFPDGVVSLPFYYPLLSEVDQFKQEKKVKKLKNTSAKKKSTCFA